MTSETDFEAPAPSTHREDVVTLLGGTWLILGLFVDGYAHSEIIDTETEDFFTIWHAIFYSGFIVTASWIAWMAYRRASAQAIRRWLPAGYGLAAVGIGLFSLGGIGDAIWHTVFGVETGIDALLSPTHLVLLVGILLILTAPFRSALTTSANRLNWKSTFPIVLSLVLVTSLVAFFTTFVWGLSQNWSLSVPYDNSGDNETFIAYGLAAGFISTAILTLPALVLLRRWTVPFGAILALWIVPSTLEWVAFGNDGTATAAAFVGAAVFEFTLVGFRQKLGRRHLIVLASTLGATSLWTARFLLLEIGQSNFVQWPAELWTGQIIYGGLIALGLALIGVPTERDLARPEPSSN